MDASNFNAVYVNGFPNAKAFIDHYKTLDDHSLSDSEMIAIYDELHEPPTLTPRPTEGGVLLS